MQIPLPVWLELGDASYFTDFLGSVTNECISLWSCGQPVPGDPRGRTPTQVYRDFARSAYAALREFIVDGTISHVAVGLGPCGELRYPSYRLEAWEYPEAGAFQCHDPAALADLARAAAAAGRPEWSEPPRMAAADGSRISRRELYGAAAAYSSVCKHGQECAEGGSDCFRSTVEVCALAAQPGDGGAAPCPRGWCPARARFFLRWYASSLLHHAERTLTAVKEGMADAAQGAPFPQLTIKLPGIHWLATHPSRAAEAAAGLNGCNCAFLLTGAESTEAGSGGCSDTDCFYDRALALAARLGVEVDFTCLEMRDEGGGGPGTVGNSGTARGWLRGLFGRPAAVTAHSLPFSLVRHVASLAQARGVPLSGENALLTLSPQQFATIAQQVLMLPEPVRGSPQSPAARLRPLATFTFLRACDELFKGYTPQSMATSAQGLTAVPRESGEDLLSSHSLRRAGLGWWDRSLVSVALASPSPQSAARVLVWASPWARFVLLVRCLRVGRPFWSTGHV